MSATQLNVYGQFDFLYDQLGFPYDQHFTVLYGQFDILYDQPFTFYMVI